MEDIELTIEKIENKIILVFDKVSLFDIDIIFNEIIEYKKEG